MILRGLDETMGEFPMWGTLAVMTTVVALLLLKNKDKNDCEQTYKPRRVANLGIIVSIRFLKK